MANTIGNEFLKYFNNLSATNAICDALETTFTGNTNLFIGFEPPDKLDACLTIIPLPGSAPSLEGDRHNSSVQIRLKTKGNRRALNTMQEIINSLHGNTSICASQPGRVMAEQSAPLILEFQEGGEYMITVSNYTIKHVKLS